jgi:aminopeptidase-like protein
MMPPFGRTRRPLGCRLDDTFVSLRSQRTLLNFSDGEHPLLDIAERSGLAFAAVKTAADALEEVGLVQERVLG